MTATPSRSRQELDRAALDAAIVQAEKSAREGGIPIGGSLMTPDGTIVALGHNLRVQTGDPTAHGETVTMRHAGLRRDFSELTMATTLSPCPMCTGTAILFRIKRVVIGENRTFRGREDWLRDAGIEVVVMDDPRCKALMAAFIAEYPDVWNGDIGDPP
jgi:cytosine deaminase